MIEVHNLSAGYQGVPVLEGVNLAFQPGEILVLAGPNGCGKSTLLRTVMGLQPRLGGEILFDGVDRTRLTSRQAAQKAAFMAQSRNVPGITAGRLVLHGRFPYLSYPRSYRPKDREAARQALEWVGAEELSNRPMAELSGGQRQKVYLAMALAQSTQTIFMDEPTVFLDVSCQLETMALARRLADSGKAVVMVLHDLCLALQTADRIALFHQGRLSACGTSQETYVSGVLEHVFGVAVGRMETGDGVQYYYRRGCT